jgi:hypothetical protein
MNADLLKEQWMPFTGQCNQQGQPTESAADQPSAPDRHEGKDALTGSPSEKRDGSPSNFAFQYMRKL